MVQADMDDEASLVEAFKDVHAVFAVTNWWEHLFKGHTQDESGEIEEEQGMNIAHAAARTPSLEHYIWSTTPSAKVILKGEHVAPHMDYKAKVDARIKSELPELAKKTTYLYFGYYPQNLVFLPLTKPVHVPSSNTYIQLLPTHPDAKVLLSGDNIVNPGIWVRQSLATAPASFGKYANVALEKLSFARMMEIWSKVTGKKGVFVQCTPEVFETLWGPGGHEIALQLKFGELVDPWAETDGFISPEELGIDGDEVVGFRGTIQRLKDLIK